MGEGNINSETLESRAAKAQEMIDEGKRTNDLALVESGKMLLASLGDPNPLPSEYYQNLPTDTKMEQDRLNKLVDNANEQSRKNASYEPHQPIINTPPKEAPVKTLPKNKLLKQLKFPFANFLKS